jgi:hypothetical protein
MQILDDRIGTTETGPWDASDNPNPNLNPNPNPNSQDFKMG